MSRRTEDLDPATRIRASAVMAAIEAYGYPVFIVRTYDTLKRQEDLYAQGRTKPGNVVTWIKKGWHNLRQNGKPAARAVDLAFKKQSRFPNRGNWHKDWPWERLKKLGEACDLKRPLKRDKGHLIDAQGESFSQAWSSSDQD